MMEDGKVKSAIYIEFVDANDVRFDVKYLGQVHPGQVIYACELLMTLHKQNLLELLLKQQEDAENKNKIVTPEAKFIIPNKK